MCVCFILPYYLARFSRRKLCIGAAECRGWRQTPVTNEQSLNNLNSGMTGFPTVSTDAHRCSKNCFYCSAVSCPCVCPCPCGGLWQNLLFLAEALPEDRRSLKPSSLARARWFHHISLPSPSSPAYRAQLEAVDKSVHRKMVYQSGRRDEMLGLWISRTANASAELHLQRERERDWKFEAEFTVQCRHFPVHLPNLFQYCWGVWCGALALVVHQLELSVLSINSNSRYSLAHISAPAFLDPGPKPQKTDPLFRPPESE